MDITRAQHTALTGIIPGVGVNTWRGLIDWGLFDGGGLSPHQL